LWPCGAVERANRLHLVEVLRILDTVERRWRSGPELVTAPDAEWLDVRPMPQHTSGRWTTGCRQPLARARGERQVELTRRRPVIGTIRDQRGGRRLADLDAVVLGLAIGNRSQGCRPRQVQ